MSPDDTIAAISTPPGRGAIAVVRVSGPGAHLVGQRLGLPLGKPRLSRYAAVLHPDDGRAVDRALAVMFRAPASYTGEDMLEISCHGGPLVPQLVLDAVCAAGARPAAPGEFTRRAFLNGKIDLLQAEAVADLIDARSPAMHRAAIFHLERGLSSRIESMRGVLLELLALLAYDIDFPEEDDGPIAPERIDRVADDMSRALVTMLALAPEGELLRDGALTVIAGHPNAGKSSVFNYLLGIDRAIVTEEEGTTRDAIEAVVGIEGVPFRLVDTAGLRESAGRVEELGIEVARSYLSRADLILFCIEAGRPPDDQELRFLREQCGSPGRVLVLRTKSDLQAAGAAEAGQAATGRRADAGQGVIATDAEVADQMHISVHSGEGLPELRSSLVRAADAGIRHGDDLPLVTHGRQVRCLKRAAGEMDAFRRGRGAGMPVEIVSTHVQAAVLALEELLGAVTTEDVLDAVFSEFCIGK